MNDYKLINDLLDNGSEVSLMKLKMVVDLNYFDIEYIKRNNRFKFVVLFKEHFEKMISYNPYPYVRSCFPYNKMIELVKIFRESFVEGFKKSPNAIIKIHFKQRFEVLGLCKDGFETEYKRRGFRNIFECFPIEKHEEIKKMFENA